MRSVNHTTTRNGDRGETLLSGVVGIALLVVALLTLGMTLSVTIAAVNRFQILTVSQADLSRFDSLLLMAAGRIEQPFILPGIAAAIPPMTPGGRFEITYLDGDSEKTVSLAQQGDEVILRVGDTLHRFSQLRLDTTEIETYPVPHLRVVIVDRSDRERVLIAPLGQVPITTDGSPRVWRQ